MKFAVIGDLHLTNNPESLTYKKILPFVLKKAEEAKVDAIIGTGDLTASGTEAQTALLKGLLAESPLPFYSTTGNAETRSNEEKAMEAQRIPPPANLPVLLLDSSSSKVCSKDIQLLAALPEKASFLLCSHYPPDMWQEEARKIFYEAVKRHAVSCVICGHVHQDGVYTMRGLDPDKASGGPPAFRIVEQQKDGFWKMEEYVLENMDPCRWPEEEKRSFRNCLGISCMWEVLESLEAAALLSIPCVELRYGALDGMSSRLFAAVEKWRNNGGRLLSLHLPDLRPDSKTEECELAQAVKAALELKCERVTLHMPAVTAAEFPSQKQLLTENFVKLLAPLMEKGITIGIENLHTYHKKWEDHIRKYGCTIRECSSWINHLRNVTSCEKIGFHCDIGHCRNNVPFSIHEYMSDFYAEKTLPFNGFHFHQIEKIEENHFRNHCPLNGFYDKVIALS
ncbi:MAG: metallophosphoesterase family protein, partial [Lentisphaeria bacterium]|nr:metallophosphoesterase family protein [Lentisphaeria bacterium]